MTAYLLAVLAATAFAVGTVLQQRGALRTGTAEGSFKFLAEIFRTPVWLGGTALKAIGWALQAAALGLGSLVVVQSVCSLSLVIALPLGVRLTGQRVGRRSIGGAIATVSGVILMLAFAKPKGGGAQPSTSAWLISGVTIGVAILFVGRAAHRRRGPLSAALFASGAGLAAAFQADLTKVLVPQLHQGLAVGLRSWSPYVLIIAMLGGFALNQSALKTGFLAPAMAATNASTLVASVILGVALFQESVPRTPGQVVLALLGLASALMGVVIVSYGESGAPESISSQRAGEIDTLAPAPLPQRLAVTDRAGRGAPFHLLPAAAAASPETKKSVDLGDYSSYRPARD